MNHITEFMSKDHDRLDNILARFRDTGDTDVAKPKLLFHEFATGLLRHIAWEEEILFPVFGEKTGMRDTGPVAVMQMEHRRIENCIEQIRQKLSANDLKEIDGLTNILLGILTEHNAKEENVLYPWIDRMMVDAEREEIFRRMGNPQPEQCEK